MTFSLEIILTANLMQQGNFINVPCCIKLAVQIISWGRCTVKQTSGHLLSSGTPWRAYS